MKKVICIVLLMLFCFNISVSAAEPYVTARSAVLIDAETGQVLFEKDKDKKVYPASITKVLTVYLAENALDKKTVLTASEAAIDSVPKDSTNIAIDYGEQLTAEQAMYAAILMSANDACNLLAEGVSGSIDEFVKLMKTTAQSMGAESTNFANTNGLPDAQHYTTASDFAKIVQEICKDKGFLKIFGETEYTIPYTNKKDEPRNFVAKHRMLRLNKYADLGIKGGKTGYTTDAMHTAVTLAEKDGKRFIAVVIGADSLGKLFSETEAMLQYGYQDFVKVEVSSSELESKKEEDVRYTPTGNVSFYLSNDQTKSDLTYTYTKDGILISDKNGKMLGVLPVIVTGFMSEAVNVILSVLKWIGIIIVSLFVLRILYVRHRKKKLRKSRWKRQRALLMMDKEKK